MKNIYQYPQFEDNPQVKMLLKPINFVRLVRSTYKTKTCEQAVKDYLKRLVVPLEFLSMIQECWDITVSELGLK